jgi:mitogen-activated protein kinase 1/3
MVKENFPTFLDRKPLFPGSSCFPLSPDENDSDDETLSHDGLMKRALDSKQNDQLMKILEVIGTPTESDLSFIKEENAK